MPCPPGRKWAGEGAQREDGELTGLLTRQGRRGRPGALRRGHIMSLRAWEEEMLLSVIRRGWGRNWITVKKEKKQSSTHQTLAPPPDPEARALRVGCTPDSGHYPSREAAARPADGSLGLEATSDGRACSPDNGRAAWSSPSPPTHAHAPVPVTSGGRAGEKLLSSSAKKETQSGLPLRGVGFSFPPV